jgi:hypothetical protein
VIKNKNAGTGTVAGMRVEGLLILCGIALAGVSVFLELLLTAHVTGGGTAGPVTVAVVNRLSTFLLVLGAGLCSGGTVLAVRRTAPSA